jgi:hypothetical protein
MSKTIYEDMTDEQDNLNWLLDSLGDLLDKCKSLVAEHLVRLNK